MPELLLGTGRFKFSAWRLLWPSRSCFVLTAGADAGAPMDGFHSFYFSVITLCTVGYGDVTPVSKVARMLAVQKPWLGCFTSLS
jgi:hypothetical protein